MGGPQSVLYRFGPFWFEVGHARAVKVAHTIVW